tara:strand:- start:26 stop:343 length:318 start_codon:yes stop_codon:yes gene_type:complete
MYNTKELNNMYMKKDNIVSELKKCVSDIEYIHNELTKSGGVLIDDIETDFSYTTETIEHRLKQVIHQLDKYKLFIDVRDDKPLGVDSPFNDGNPINKEDNDGHTS